MRVPETFEVQRITPQKTTDDPRSPRGDSRRGRRYAVGRLRAPGPGECDQPPRSPPDGDVGPDGSDTCAVGAPREPSRPDAPTTTRHLVPHPLVDHSTAQPRMQGVSEHAVLVLHTPAPSPHRVNRLTPGGVFEESPRRRPYWTSPRRYTPWYAAVNTVSAPTSQRTPGATPLPREAACTTYAMTGTTNPRWNAYTSMR